jgi:hypothetical protein
MDDFAQEASRQKKLKDEYRSLFLSDAGRMVLLDLLQYTGVIRPTYCKGDPEGSAFSAGRQDVGLMLLDILDMRGYQRLIEMEKYGIDLIKMGEM